MTSNALPTNIQTRRSAWQVAYLDATLPAELAASLWNEPRQLLADGRPLRAVGARRTVQLRWGLREYVLKHYAEPSRRHAFKQSLQPSRAWRTWRTGHRLADAGIATPRPLACLERRWGPFRRDSYLMYPFVTGQPLAAYIGGDVDASPQQIQAYWCQLNALWKQLTQLRASLGDANMTNFIISPDGQLWVIDLDKTRFHRLEFSAKRHQTLRWNQVLRSAGKHQQRRAIARSA